MDKWQNLLAKHQVIILPTETVYGLFADAMSEKSVDKVYSLKKRPRDKAMNLNVSSFDEILFFSKEHPAYLKELYDAFLPGPLTIILKSNDKVPFWINSGLDTVGFRVPNHPKTQEIIQSYGPLIGPSANLSGTSSGVIYQDIQKDFKGVLGIADDESITGRDSTILDISGPKAKILRQGILTKEDILSQVPDIPFENNIIEKTR